VTTRATTTPGGMNIKAFFFETIAADLYVSMQPMVYLEKGYAFLTANIASHELRAFYSQMLSYPRRINTYRYISISDLFGYMANHA
jgi:hypothetical protein